MVRSLSPQDPEGFYKHSEGFYKHSEGFYKDSEALTQDLEAFASIRDILNNILI